MAGRETRLADLAALLARAERPRSLAEIAEVIPEYRNGEAGRQMFVRDKGALAEAGLPVEEESDRYRIARERLYLPELDLTEEERAALHVALRAVPLIATPLSTVGAALGGFEHTDTPMPVRADLDVLDVVPGLFAAVRERRLVAFAYDGSRREVEPYGLLFRNGWWYLHARDRGDGVAKNFRVDRIVGPVDAGGAAGAFVPPAGLDLRKALPPPWQLPGDEPAEAVVRVDEVMARLAAEQVGDSGTCEWEGDAVTIRLTVTHRAAFRAWVLSLADHAVVLAPDELRADLRAWLTRLVEAAP